MIQIPAFLAGVLATILAEAVMIVVIAGISVYKDNKKKKGK